MTSRFDCVLTGGTLVSGDGALPVTADVGVRDGRVAEVGELRPEAGDVHINCTGRTLFPGFVDAHSHAEGSIFHDEVQLALLRQGVTSIVLGQDGVSLAPGSGTYAQDYFGSLNGWHPTYRGGRVRDLLDTYDEAVAVNVAYAVPLGTVRYEVLGPGRGPADAVAMHAMRELVAAGLEDGAVGASSGLDYVPGQYASTAELTAVVEPLRGHGGVYITHMRGGYEENSGAGLDEVAAIAIGARVPIHVSHLHARRALLEPLIDRLVDRGVDGSFDAYPYRRGFSLLAMPVLPADFLCASVDDAVAWLATDRSRGQLVEHWYPAAVHATWGRIAKARLAHVPSAHHARLEGLTLAEAAERRGVTPAELVHELLVATRLRVTAVFAAPPHTTDEDWIGLLEHAWHLVGSDGIFHGGAPHPRAWGTFARLLAEHTGPGHAYTLDDAATHLASRAADRFGLVGRGRLTPGSAADIAIVDLARIRDTASYEEPRLVAEGIDTVLVNGAVVLSDGVLTGRRTGRALRWGAE